MSESQPSITVVVVSWNGRNRLDHCLRALVEQTDQAFATVLVDNASDDGTAGWVRSTYPRVHILRNARNLGFAAACNLGIEASSSDWVATLNDDAIPHFRWIASLRLAARAASRSVGMLQSDVRRQSDPRVVSSHGIEICVDGSFRDRAAGLIECGNVAETEIFAASAAAAMYRRSMLEEIRISTGFFDQGCFAYFEDVDLGWRARLAGWDAWLVPNARVVHAEHATSERMRGRFLTRQCRKNRARVLCKNASGRLLLGSLPLVVLDAMRLALASASDLHGFHAGVREGLRQRHEVDRLIRVPRSAVERRWIRESS